MILITGGAFQGKLEYADAHYPDLSWADGRSCTQEELFSCGGIYHFEEYVRRMKETEEEDSGEEGSGHPLALQRQAAVFAETLLRKNPSVIIVTQELGCGIVPLDRSDRIWREKTGRICTELAARSSQVVRVICGIGIVLKEEKR